MYCHRVPIACTFGISLINFKLHTVFIFLNTAQKEFGFLGNQGTGEMFKNLPIKNVIIVIKIPYFANHYMLFKISSSIHIKDLNV